MENNTPVKVNRRGEPDIRGMAKNDILASIQEWKENKTFSKADIRAIDFEKDKYVIMRLKDPKVSVQVAHFTVPGDAIYVDRGITGKHIFVSCLDI